MLALLLSFTSCEQRKEARAAMRAELDVFSGQSNPSWDLTEAEVTELKRRLEKLPSSQVGVEPGLGYRGVIISNPQGLRGLSAEIRVYGNVVLVRGDTGDHFYQDVNGLEDWLLSLARQAGHAEILKEVGK